MKDNSSGRVGGLPSARGLLVSTCLVVFMVELSVMFGLEVFGLRMPILMRALLDALLLTAIMGPLLVLFIYRPFFRAIDELQHIEEYLVRELGRQRVRDAWRSERPADYGEDSKVRNSVRPGSPVG